ncbi:hypothetical protein [Amycolatopsis antarctica]|uniref:hypothetical protein n=1 Tax=Amycolatopsis antarctica TaxID=1854586 RepID=UPI001055B992|nr:hypothetical protein [Amycolatopsis antarctica]
MINSAGWEVHRRWMVAGVVPLTRPGTTVTSGPSTDEPRLHGVQPAELREHPAVADRARRFQVEHGFDPLAPAELNLLRTRNNHWLRKFLRPGWIAGLLLAVAPFPLIIGLQEESAIAVNIGAAMAVLGVVAVGFAWRIRLARKSEIGAHLDVLREFKDLYRTSR